MSRRKPPVNSLTIHRWTKAGILNLENPGTGRRQVVPEEECRAIRAADSVRRLAGVTPNDAAGYPASTRALMIAAAEAARTNPPGTVVELPSPSPDVRHVLIVPEPYPTPKERRSIAFHFPPLWSQQPRTPQVPGLLHVRWVLSCHAPRSTP